MLFNPLSSHRPDQPSVYNLYGLRLLLGSLLCAVVGPVLATTIVAAPISALFYDEAVILGQPTSDRPPSTSLRRGAVGDTVGFGFVDVDGFAIEGEMWTWDHGLFGLRGSSFEGWEFEDLSEQAAVTPGVVDVASYVIEDPCACSLSGNVLVLHDDQREHPQGQHVLAISNPVDVLNDVSLPGAGDLVILFDWSQYSELPPANGVFFRPRFDYFPFTDPNTGAVGWSGPVGQRSFFTTGNNAICAEYRNVATEHGIPAQVEQVRFVYELYASCDAFGIQLGQCTETTNFTPILDNAQMRFTRGVAAPPVSHNPGTQFQDVFDPGILGADPNLTGDANVTLNLSMANHQQIIARDSLYVSGPNPEPGFEYETRLWFRVARKGPGANTVGYDHWRTRAQQDGGLDDTDGVTNIEEGDFATAKMDSSQTGEDPSIRGFASYYIEEDSRFDEGSGELSDGNEIITDGVLLTGTQIEYFVSSNYIMTPGTSFLLPDTSGGFFSEFEILPALRDDGGVLKSPCILYVDAYNRGAESVIEAALHALGLDFDRYDYLDASSNWKTPLARGLTADANSGGNSSHLMVYRTIIVNTGDASGTVMWADDFNLFEDWLYDFLCGDSGTPMGLILNGDNMAGIVNSARPMFLDQLGAVFLADSYSDEGGIPDESYCVQLESPSAGSFDYGTSTSTTDYDYDAFGNGCPDHFSFDVLGASGSGVGNRVYVNTASGEETHYAQITNELGPGALRHRTVLDGVSYHHQSERDAVEECLADSTHTVTAALNEIASALEWVFGVGNIPDLCENPCSRLDPTDAPVVGSDARVTRLFQNSPNPFNPYTTLRFSLAAKGPVELIIYDVNGRQVKTLVSAVLEAGAHEAVWDGTSESGEDVAAGVFWSQLDTAGIRTNKKMVFLKR